MQNYLLRNLSELAQKRAVLMREEAQLLDILARDLKREAGRLEEAPTRRLVREPLSIEPPPAMLMPGVQLPKLTGFGEQTLSWINDVVREAQNA